MSRKPPRKTTKRPDHAAPSGVLAQARLRGGAGVHTDQRRKSDPKQTRRDKTYKEDR
jgi:hypothetical protein